MLRSQDIGVCLKTTSAGTYVPVIFGHGPGLCKLHEALESCPSRQVQQHRHSASSLMVGCGPSGRYKNWAQALTSTLPSGCRKRRPPCSTGARVAQNYSLKDWKSPLPNGSAYLGRNHRHQAKRRSATRRHPPPGQPAFTHKSRPKRRGAAGTTDRRTSRLAAATLSRPPLLSRCDNDGLAVFETCGCCVQPAPARPVRRMNGRTHFQTCCCCARPAAWPVRRWIDGLQEKGLSFISSRTGKNARFMRRDGRD
jgi:hypothetical protein